MRLLKILVALVILAFVALAGYAYLGDMGPRQQEMRQPVSLDTGAPAQAAPIVIAPAAAPAADAAPAPDAAPQAAPAGAPEPAAEPAGPARAATRISV